MSVKCETKLLSIVRANKMLTSNELINLFNFLIYVHNSIYEPEKCNQCLFVFCLFVRDINNDSKIIFLYTIYQIFLCKWRIVVGGVVVGVAVGVVV